MASRSSEDSGAETRAPRRSASSRSVSARSPNRASTTAGARHNSSVPRTRLGSAVLRTCRTARAFVSRPAGSSSRSTSCPPASTLPVDSASQPVSSSTRWGSRAANSSVPATSGAAAVRTSVSATASQASRISDIADRIVSGAPGSASACASGGNAAASSCRNTASAGSSGPTRHWSYPPGLAAGSSRPRPINPTAAVTATDHAARLAVAESRSTASSAGIATSSGTSLAGTVRRRNDLAVGNTSSMLVSATSPVTPYSASAPSRPGSPGINTASPVSCWAATGTVTPAEYGVHGACTDRNPAEPRRRYGGPISCVPSPRPRPHATPAQTTRYPPAP